MAKKVQLGASVDREVKERAMEVLSELGLSMSQAINIFLTEIAETGEIPGMQIISTNAETDNKKQKSKSNTPSQRLTLKVYPKGYAREIYRTFEISARDTLDDLCNEILVEFDFDNDHLYEFSLTGKLYDPNNFQSSPEGRGPSTRIKMEKLGLRKGQNITFLFDYGDEWIFIVHVNKVEEELSYSPPRPINEKGILEQYPKWDDDEEEDYDEDNDDENSEN